MRVRLDARLVELGLVPSREKAKRLILAGAVRVDQQLRDKPSQLVAASAQVEVAAPERFVSRGGHKLEAAVAAWAITATGLVCLDIGASTGGFTDCLLQHGARRVHAVDVGHGQLEWRLRQDPRVVVHEGLNARSLREADLGELVDLISIDVSFISLKKILPAAVAVLKPDGRLIALIKPQFEAGRQFVKRGGVVRDSAVHDQVTRELTAWSTQTLGLRLLGLIQSPLLGPAGNKEFLMGLAKS